MALKAALIATITFAVAFAACSSEPSASPEPLPSVDEVSGTYTADIPFRDFQEVPGETLRSYAGGWRIVLDLGDPFYSIENSGYGSSSGTLTQTGSGLVFDDPPAPKGAFNCAVNGTPTLKEGAGSYTFVVDGSELTLTVDDEPCPLREAILVRTWTKKT